MSVTFTGSGTQESPYLIQTAEQFKAAFEDNNNARYYYEVTNNIDMGRTGLGGYIEVYSHIDGMGHVISNCEFSSPYFYQRLYGSLKNIHMEWYPNTPTRKLSYLCVSDASGNFMENVRLDVFGDFSNFSTFYTNVNNCVTVIITENTVANGRRTYLFQGSRNIKTDITGNDTDVASYPGIDTAYLGCHRWRYAGADSPAGGLLCLYPCDGNNAGGRCGPGAYCQSRHG